MVQDEIAPTDSGDVTADNTIEQVAEHVTLEWLHDGKLSVLTVASIDFASIDAWSAAAIAAAQICVKADKLYLAVHDVSAHGLSFTPYIREKTKETIQAQKGVEGRTAVVVPMSWPGMMMRLFLNQLMQIVSDRPIKGFRTREEAVAWVAEAIQ